MDEHFFTKLKSNFEQFVSSPLPFLEGCTEVSDNFKLLSKTIYDSNKSSAISSRSGPIPKLIIEGFDHEQIWQEIELFNKKEAATCLKAAEYFNSQDISQFMLKKHESDDETGDEDDDLSELEPVEGEAEPEAESDVEGFHFEESEGDDEETEEEEEDFNQHDVVTEQTEVDDDFFSLRKMEKFLEDEDRKYELEQKKPVEGDIDYFEDIPSDGISSSEDENEEYSSKIKSSRNLKYSDYFDEPISSIKNRNENISETEIDDRNNAQDQKQSHFEKHQKQISQKIGILEERALAPAEWQMTGEVKAASRPENSLLQEMVQFDHVARPPIDITEEHTKDLESLIKQRIMDCAWDDIERKYKPDAEPAEYKKRIVLDSSQSKLTLSEIYEKEYMEKKQKLGKEVDEKENEEHNEIKKDMDDLFRKLDALSNFHFVAPPPEPEIKLITNLPSIAKEEVQPVTQAESNILAPEEIFSKSKSGEEKSTLEKSSTDKKRERRKKKIRMKVRANARLEKLKKLDPTSDKVKTLEAVDQLKKAAKAPGSNTTIIKTTKSNGKLTSQKFFSELQDKGSNFKKKKALK
ncbi:U3 small nucleolar ribonucleoprotein MPP10-like [Styela clava]